MDQPVQDCIRQTRCLLEHGDGELDPFQSCDSPSRSDSILVSFVVCPPSSIEESIEPDRSIKILAGRYDDGHTLHLLTLTLQGIQEGMSFDKTQPASPDFCDWSGTGSGSALQRE